RLAQISENHGAAGVLRDVTERNRRRQQLESFKRAIEDSVDGVAILEDEEFVFVDDTHVEMYGFESQDELLGGTWRQLYGPEEIKRLESEVFPELADSGHWNGKVRGHRSDGSTFPAEVSLTLVEHGRLVCTVRDETEQREREQELKLKDRAMDATDVGIQITDATQAENPLVYVNEGFEQITGYSRDEALGRNPRFLQGEDSESEQLERLRSAIAAEETVAVELKNYRKDGTSYWSHLSVTPVRDETGQVTNYIGIQQDITEYREVRQELREQRERLELTLSETGTGVAEWDLETGTVTWNETLVDMFGRDITNIEEFFDGVHPQDRPTVQSGLERMTNTGRPWIGEFRLQTDIGEYRWLGARAVELEREGSTVLAVGTDITERKERERALEALYESTRDLIDVDRPAEAFEAGISALDDIPGLTVTGVYRRQNDILVRVSEAESGPVEAPDRVTRGQTPLWEAIEQGSPVRYDDVANIDDGIDRGSVTSSAYFPIGDHGVIAVGATTEGHPNESQRQLIEVLTRNLAAVLDALERQRSLRASERRYRTLAEHIPNGGVVLFDDDQQIRLAAGELLEDFGVHEGDAVGIITDDDDQRLATWCAAALEGDRTDQRIKRGGQTLRMQVVPIDSGEGTASGLILAQDITAKVRREQELARERERFRMLIEGVDEYAFFITDETGAIQTWNAGAERLFGYDTAAALGISVAQLYTADDRARGRPDRILQQARIAGESADEGWRVCADGSQFYADSRYASLETEAGEFRGFAHIVRDMTERRRQRRRTELFVTESTDVVTIIEPDGTIEYVSRSVTEILGYGPDALVGENLFDYVHPEDREAAMSAFFESVGSPGADFDFEGRFKSGDGEWRNVDGQGQNMVEEEAIDGLLLYLSDITDAKQRARRFEGIFNQTFQLIGLLNPDGTIIEANDTALAFGGFDRDEVIGTRLCELSWYDNSDTAGQVTEAVDRAADGEFVRYETELQGTDGLATIDFSLKPIVDEADDVTMLVAEGRDITDRQRQRRQLGVMHRVIRHNMRNDLTKVRGWAEMLAETTDPEQRAVTLKTIGEVLDKWSRMTEQMRKIQRILQADREQETLVDPATLLDRLADAVTEEYPEATVETTDLEAGGTQIPALVGEAVTELLENAIAASPTQTVTAACRRPSADWLEVIISDDGPGLPEMEARVLETGEETPLNHGEGLGLWLVRTAVTQVGGDVAVDVYPDGTDVRLRLPVRRRTDH
ncbi:MAG: PAS domain S-box protein, partial [Salinarchaeum sp.]